MRYLGIEQGLSNNSVTSIYKDVHGFIWIGTNDGLNKYDGSTVRIYRNIWGDNQSLVDNHINRITGINHSIFIGTQKGLVRYNYNTSKFYPIYATSAKSTKPVKISCNINALRTDKKDNVYIGTDYQGLYIYNELTKLGKQVAFQNGKINYSVQAISIGPDNRIWLFVRDLGLCLLQDGAIRLVNSTVKYANCITLDSTGTLWIGTDKDMFEYDTHTEKMSRSLLNDQLKSDKIVDIEITKSHEFWVATNGGGVNIIKGPHHQATYIVSNNSNNTIVRSNAISTIYEDDESRKWIATFRGGVYSIDSKPNQFKLITNNPFNPNSLVNNFVLSFCEDKRKNLWIGTDGGGISYWDKVNNHFSNFTHSTDPSSIRSDFVVSIVRDSANQIWMGLFNGGIDRFDERTKRFIHYDCYNTTTKSTDRNLWKLYVDSRHRIWAGTTRGGALYLYNNIKDKFELFDDRLINIHALFEDHSGVLWAGDYANLIKVDIQNKKHQHFDLKKAVRSITEDGFHNLWLGTEGGGLVKFDASRRNFRRYTQSDGLSSNSLLNVIADSKNNIWANSFNGLIEFVTKNKTFRSFTASDGLQSNQFNYNAALKLSSGELVFGGIRGFNIFSPDSIQSNIHSPNLEITGLQINNKSIESDSAYTNNQAIADLKKITIPYNEATIAINYTAPEYLFVDKFRYAYYLEGWDHGWNEVGDLKTAYYSRLNEGNYIFKIKATNTDGTWSDKELQLQIIVLPPWYRSWFAYLIYLSVLALVIYWIWRYRNNQTKLKYEVQIANLNTEREKELNEKKLTFFTNVSHEFRTPLTLIINPIKDLLQQSNTHNDELNTIYRNARRLLGLVDQLLLFRKAESVNDSLNISDINISLLCHDVYLCFVQQAKSRHIDYQFMCDCEEVVIQADREKIEIAIFNLVSNALKFTPNGGAIMVKLTKCEKTIELSVVDNGCGVSSEASQHIFDKFYQVKDTSKSRKGFGIGLYLVKNFVEQHLGTVQHFNNEMKGATFIIRLPFKKTLIEDVKIDGIPEIQDRFTMTDLEPWQQVVDEPAGNFELLISDKQSVLIIDDNAEFRTYTKKIFKDEYKLYEAENGETGLEIIKSRLPDVVICDINMAGISGIDLCNIIKQDSSLSHIPVILLTGDPNPDRKLKGIEVGAIDFVSKPFDKELLIARVQGILRDRRDLQKYFYNEITMKSNTRNISEHNKEFLYKIISIIENYIIDPEFDVKRIADDMGMGYSSLFKTIKSITGQSVNSFVRFVRLRKAAEMMINTECNVNEAALNTGFNDIKYFREQFIKQFGIKPSEFIKQHRSAFHKKYSVEHDFV